jgi:uncharacterized protein
MKTTVIYHNADFDGIFCREIAKKFLPDAELIGWDWKDNKIPFPIEGLVYVLDLAPDCFISPDLSRIIWIDHHKSAIAKWPKNTLGYRIDGVAACRLAWQWFAESESWDKMDINTWPTKDLFIERLVKEPIAVRLAGEYDIWDKRDTNVELFQFGLRSKKLLSYNWEQLLDETLDETFQVTNSQLACSYFLERGTMLQRYQQQEDRIMVQHRSFIVEWEELKFLALTTARCNSLTFMYKDVHETGHDALMGFCYDGTKWIISLYHAKHRTDIDLSAIAVKYGGGGHRGACGFRLDKLPFI